MAHILIIDDSALILQMVEMVVTGAGHTATTAETWTDAEAAYPAADLVVTDLNLPDQPDPLARLHALGTTPVIILSGRPQAELDQLAATHHARAVSKDAGFPGIAAALPDVIAELTAD